MKRHWTSLKRYLLVTSFGSMVLLSYLKWLGQRTVRALWVPLQREK